MTASPKACPLPDALGMINMPHPDNVKKRIVGLVFNAGENPTMHELREAYEQYRTRPALSEAEAVAQAWDYFEYGSDHSRDAFEQALRIAMGGKQNG